MGRSKVHQLGRRGNRTVSGRWKRGQSAHPETQFRPGTSGNPLGRPRTKILRDLARQIAEQPDPTGKRIVAEEIVHLLLKYARKGSLGHLQTFIALCESDAPAVGTGSGQLDVDAVNRLVGKLCRAS